MTGRCDKDECDEFPEEFYRLSIRMHISATRRKREHYGKPREKRNDKDRRVKVQKTS